MSKLENDLTMATTGGGMSFSQKKEILNRILDDPMLIKATSIALNQHYKKIVDDDGKAITCKQEIADATYESLKLFEELENLTHTIPDAEYEYYEKLDGGFNLKTTFYSKEQIEEFAITVGRRILSSSGVKYMCDGLENKEKLFFIWDVNLSDIARIPDKYIEHTGKDNSKLLLNDDIRDKMSKIKECISRYLDEVPCAYYLWKELGVNLKGELVYLYRDGSDTQLKGKIGEDGYPDILNSRNESVFNYKEEMELTDKDIDYIRGIIQKDELDR